MQKHAKGEGVGRRLANLLVAARAEQLEVARTVVMWRRDDVVHVMSKAKEIAVVAFAPEVPLQAEPDDVHLVVGEAELDGLVLVEDHDSDDGVHVIVLLLTVFALGANIETSFGEALVEHTRDRVAGPAPCILVRVLLRNMISQSKTMFSQRPS
jgi:hypothetical protein